MGCAVSTADADGSEAGLTSRPSSLATMEEMRTSRSIDRMIREDERRLAREVKVRSTPHVDLLTTQILLLGAGGAGKTTMLKQIRVLNKLGFTAAELELYRYQVFRNICESMQRILLAMEEDWDMRLESVDAEVRPTPADQLTSTEAYSAVPRTLAGHPRDGPVPAPLPRRRQDHLGRSQLPACSGPRARDRVDRQVRGQHLSELTAQPALLLRRDRSPVDGRLHADRAGHLPRSRAVRGHLGDCLQVRRAHVSVRST